MGMLEMPAAHQAAPIDAYGAPEFFVNGFDMTKITNDCVRYSYWSRDQDERIVRCKILFPVADILRFRVQVAMFLTEQRMAVVM